MARVLGLFPSALAASAGGMSERAWERQVRAAGLGARSSEMLNLWKIAKSITTASPQEPFRDISKVPAANETSPWPVKNAGGVIQNVTLAYRDRTTGEIKQTFYRVKSENGVTRETAMAQAIQAYSDTADDYDQDLIGAVHTSSYSLVEGLV